MQYKTVAGPAAMLIKKNETYESAVHAYADIINKEAAEGWEFLCIQPVPVTKNKGCIAGIMAGIFKIGSQYETIEFNMLVFVKK